MKTKKIRNRKDLEIREEFKRGIEFRQKLILRSEAFIEKIELGLAINR